MYVIVNQKESKKKQLKMADEEHSVDFSIKLNKWMDNCLAEKHFRTFSIESRYLTRSRDKIIEASSNYMAASKHTNLTILKRVT